MKTFIFLWVFLEDQCWLFNWTSSEMYAHRHCV